MTQNKVPESIGLPVTRLIKATKSIMLWPLQKDKMKTQNSSSRGILNLLLHRKQVKHAKRLIRALEPFIERQSLLLEQDLDPVRPRLAVQPPSKDELVRGRLDEAEPDVVLVHAELWVGRFRGREPVLPDLGRKFDGDGL